MAHLDRHARPSKGLPALLPTSWPLSASRCLGRLWVVTATPDHQTDGLARGRVVVRAGAAAKEAGRRVTNDHHQHNGSWGAQSSHWR